MDNAFRNGAIPITMLGTTSHIDHGKTTLVRALTGVDTDHLPGFPRRRISCQVDATPA